MQNLIRSRLLVPVFNLVRALEGGFGGWVVPKKWTCLPMNKVRLQNPWSGSLAVLLGSPVGLTRWVGC